MSSFNKTPADAVNSIFFGRQLRLNQRWKKRHFDSCGPSTCLSVRLCLASHTRGRQTETVSLLPSCLNIPLDVCHVGPHLIEQADSHYRPLLCLCLFYRDDLFLVLSTQTQAPVYFHNTATGNSALKKVQVLSALIRSRFI